jgi:hypothetical protein
VSQPLARISPATERDTIAAWLDMLVAILDLPDDQRRSVRAELESHLRERVRDLILSGDSEHQAAKTAIAELGDAASLARRYSRTIEPSHRRSLMQVAALSVAGAALAFGIGAIGGRTSQPEPTPKLVEGAPVDVAGSPAQVKARVFEESTSQARLALAGVTIKGPAEIRWSEFIATLSTSLPIKVVRWDVLTSSGIQSEDVIRIPQGEFNGGQVLDLAKEAGATEVGLREVDGGFEISTREHIDTRERTLVVYDATDLVQNSGQSPEACLDEISQLLSSLTFREGWEENGGNMASIRRVGSKLFIQAPLRYHSKIHWIMDELARSEPAAGEFRARAVQGMEVPVLGSLPLIGGPFTDSRALTPLAPGQTYTFQVSADGQSVVVSGPDGTVTTARRFSIQGTGPIDVNGQPTPGMAPGGSGAPIAPQADLLPGK